jgi:urease accessory protein
LPCAERLLRCEERFSTNTPGRTRLQIATQEPPWRVIRAFELENGAALAHLHNVSGGILAGDHLSLDIELAAGASAQVTTTSSTRLYRHRPGSPDSSQLTTITIGDGALLEYLPDAIIPYAGSRHTQRTEILLGEHATLFWWETLAPGRHAMGETFAFDRLKIETSVRSARQPLLIEDFELEPLKRPLESAARLGGYTHLANFYAFRTGCSSSSWRELENLLNEFAGSVDKKDSGCKKDGSSSSIWGASTLAADGVILRGLSHTARDLPATLAGAWSIARRFLTGENALPPRKIR